MKVKCRYCGSMISNTTEVCPSCGAPNEDMVRGGLYAPKTMGALTKYCSMKNIDTYKLKVSIGQVKDEPFWTFIVENGGSFLVCKNLKEGAREVLYEGGDEAYAVFMVYDKIRRDEVLRMEQENLRHMDVYNEMAERSGARKRRKNRSPGSIFLKVVIAFMVVYFGIFFVGMALLLLLPILI